MKKFKYMLIVFFYLLSVNTLHAQADIYLATGVLTSEKKTDIALGKLEKDLKASNPELYKNQDFKVAYNTTHGFWDFIEGAAQLFNQNGWSMYWDSFITLTHNALTQYYIDYFSGLSENHNVDLTKQIKSYKASINAGNQVIVIAHSQGNYFTNEVYASLSECQKKSFYMLGIANPASKVSGMSEGRGMLATLDNDPITYVPSSMNANIINDERFIIEGIDLKHVKFHYFDYYRHNNDATKSIIEYFSEYAITHYYNNIYNPTISMGEVIDIKLEWGSSDINLELNSEIGTKDIFAAECSPLEHYYVASENDIYPGKYMVSIHNYGYVDTSLLPHSITLSIQAMDSVAIFDFDIIAPDMLNIGDVVEIVVSEYKKPRIFVQQNPSITALRCYGSCEKVESSGSYQKYLYSIRPKLKQALLGPLSNASIALSDAKEFQSGVPFYESSTSGGRSLLTSGIFYFPNTVLTTIHDNDYYVLSVDGGVDIDTDDNGVLDSSPTQNLGSIHTVISGNELKTKKFKVSLLTEIAYQVTKELFNEELNTILLRERLDDVAKRLLAKDINGDDNIDYEDLLVWTPRYDKDKLLKDYNDNYQFIVKNIYLNNEIYNLCYQLVYDLR